MALSRIPYLSFVSLHFADLWFFIDRFSMPRSTDTISLRSCPLPQGFKGRSQRPTAFDFIVPKVMIWATLSLPYFVTYQLLSRLFLQKSTSISGMLIRSGLRNRSKVRSYFGHVGDPQTISDETSRRNLDRGLQDVMRFCVVDEIGNMRSSRRNR
jgi:hypothetical protein